MGWDQWSCYAQSLAGSSPGGVASYWVKYKVLYTHRGVSYSIILPSRLLSWVSYLYHSLKALPAPFIPLPLSFTSVIPRKYKCAVAESCDSTVLLEAASFKESSESASLCILLYPVNLQIRFEIWSCYYVSVGWKPEFYQSVVPLQCSCLETPRDERAWWAAVCGVAQSRTRLKWLSSSIDPDAGRDLGQEEKGTTED